MSRRKVPIALAGRRRCVADRLIAAAKRGPLAELYEVERRQRSARKLHHPAAIPEPAQIELHDADVPVVADICRKLDGIALAIELAAGRVDTLGIGEIADLLDNRLRLLTRGRRTALPRHQTLRATLDWSYELLSDGERTILWRLGVFAGWFSADAAMAAVSHDGSFSSLEDLANLVTKSLLAADVSGMTAYYRLLDTTRAYALEKLSEAGEAAVTASHHATHYRDFLEQAHAEWETRPTRALLTDYGRQLDNVRVALDWAFGPDGDTALALALTAAAVPLWKHLSLMEECRARVNQALTSRLLDKGGGTARDMQLQGALAFELRAAVSLGRLLRAKDRAGEAADLLAPVYQRLPEGFGTRDATEARALLA